MKKRILTFALSALLTFGSASCVFAESKAELVKEYNFKSSGGELKYDAPEKIREGGRTYKLTGIEYRTNDNVSIRKTYRTANKEDFKPEDTIRHITKSGKKISLQLQDITWKTEEVEYMQQYSSQREIPGHRMQTVELEGKENDKKEELEVELRLTGVADKSRVEEFAAPATFYGSAPDVRKFSFGDKIIMVSEDSPIWEGYEEDVKEYLGVSDGSYAVTGGSWEGDFKETDNGYVRTAIFTGTKDVPVYEATFKGVIHEVTATYTGTDPDLATDATATASYERAFGLRESIMIGAGVLVSALAAAAILFLIRRRRRENDA